MLTSPQVEEVLRRTPHALRRALHRRHGERRERYLVRLEELELDLLTELRVLLSPPPAIRLNITAGAESRIPPNAVT